MRNVLGALFLLAVVSAAYGMGVHTANVIQYGKFQAQFSQDAKSEIINALDLQAWAWNKGDIEGFMQTYWNSDELRFASSGTVKYGWATTLERYQARYPDKVAMGSLTFTDMHVQALSHSDALVFGRWQLTRDTDKPNGLFTLHMRWIDGEWKIVSDHTSSTPAQ